MEQRKLSRTIEKFLSEAPNFKKVDDLLQYVLHQIIGDEHIGIGVSHGTNSHGLSKTPLNPVVCKYIRTTRCV